MAGTVIDSLVVTLGLDGQKYTEGQKAALEQNKKLRADADTTAKELESKGGQASEFFGKLTKEALGFFAVVTAGRGFQELISGAIQTGAATGYAAKFINMSAKELSAWNNVAVQAGGTADGMTNSLTGLSQTIQSAALGIPTQGFNVLTRGMGIALDNPDGSQKSINDLMLEISGWMKSHSPSQDLAIGEMLGFDPGTIQTLEQGPDALKASLASQSSVSDAQAAASAALVKSFGQLQVQVDALAGDIEVFATPALLDGLHNFTMGIWAIDQAFKGNFAPLEAGLNAELNQPVPDHPLSPRAQNYADQTAARLAGESRPVRNNNPGDLYFDNQPGATKEPNGPFAVFGTMQQGIAALEAQIGYDQTHHGINTIAGLILRNSGATDPNDTGAGNPDHNNVKAYIASVVRDTGYGANQPIDLTDPKVQAAVAQAIANQEAGYGNISIANNQASAVAGYFKSIVSPLPASGPPPNIGGLPPALGLPPNVTSLVNSLRSQPSSVTNNKIIKVSYGDIHVTAPSGDAPAIASAIKKGLTDNQFYMQANSGLQ